MDADVLNPGYEKLSTQGLHEDFGKQLLSLWNQLAVKAPLYADAATDNDIKRSVPKSVNISEPSRESEPSQPVGINGRGSSQFPSVRMSSHPLENMNCVIISYGLFYDVVSFLIL